MGWLSRFRRRRRGEDYVGRHRPGDWAELALPPTGRAPVGPVASQDRPITAAPVPAVVPMAPVADMQPRQRVRLGFADGTLVDIEDGSIASDALTRTVSRLLGE